MKKNVLGLSGALVLALLIASISYAMGTPLSSTSLESYVRMVLIDEPRRNSVMIFQLLIGLVLVLALGKKCREFVYYFTAPIAVHVAVVFTGRHDLYYWGLLSIAALIILRIKHQMRSTKTPLATVGSTD